MTKRYERERVEGGADAAHHVGARLPIDEYDRLDKLARAASRSKSALIREAIARYLDESEVAA